MEISKAVQQQSGKADQAGILVELTAIEAERLRAEISPGALRTIGPENLDERWGGRAPWMHVPLAAGEDRTYGGIGREQWLEGPAGLLRKILKHGADEDLGARLYGGVIIDCPWGRDVVMSGGELKRNPSFSRLWDIRDSHWGQVICPTLGELAERRIPFALYLGSPWEDPRLKSGPEGAAILDWVCGQIRAAGAQFVILDATAETQGTAEAKMLLQLIADRCGLPLAAVGIEACPMIGPAFDHLSAHSVYQSTWANRHEQAWASVKDLEECGADDARGQRKWLQDGGGARPDASMDKMDTEEYAAALIPWAARQGAHAVFAPWGISLRRVLEMVKKAGAGA